MAAIEMWNKGVDQLKTKLDDPEAFCRELVREREENPEEDTPEDAIADDSGNVEADFEHLEQAASTLKENLSIKLRKIQLKRTENNFLLLGPMYRVFFPKQFTVGVLS